MDYYQFGRNVAIYGDTLVVSAHNASYGSLSNAGIVYIFTRDTSGEWALKQTIEDGSSFSLGNYIDSNLDEDLDLSNNDIFGSSVDIYKDRIAVSAFGNDDGGSERGAIYTFRIDSSAGKVRPEYFFTSGDGTNANENKTFVIQNITDPGYKNEYGFLALGDETLAVGIHYLDDTNSNSGGVIIYEELSGGGWSQTLKISNNTGASGKLDINTLSTDDNFGTSVAIENNVLIVGSRYKDHGGTDRGAAYTFIKKDGEWTKQYVISDNSTLTNTQLDGFTPLSISLGDDTKFGGGVAISGSNILISAPPKNSKKGHVYVFDGKITNQERGIATENGDIIFNGKEDEGEYLSISDTDWSEVESISLWTKQEESLKEKTGDINTLRQYFKISDNGGDGSNGKLDINLGHDDYFGNSVSYSDDTFVVGARRDDDGGTNKGAVYIFEKSNGAWSQTLKISDNGGDGSNVKLGISLGLNDYFGSSVSYSDGKLFVGATGDNDGGTSRGAVYIFEKDSSGVWSQTIKISDNGGDGSNGKLGVNLHNINLFGSSVSYSDDTLIVGAYRDGDGGDGRGAVYIFEKSSGVWSQTLKISDNGGDGSNGKLDINLGDDDYFGSSVSYLDDQLFVGAPWDDDGGNRRGAVYLFEKSSGVWSKTLKISDNGGGDGKLDVNLYNYYTFGSSVSYLDDTLVVGAHGDDNQGVVHIFEKSNGVWSQTLKISDNGGGDGLLYVSLDTNFD